MTAKLAIRPTAIERTFGEDEIIVSKTDLKGRITYANRVFCRVAEYSESELLGQPHSIIRHPDMPRAVFKLVWDTLGEGREIFGYVKNLAKSGAFYWVFAHVTPSVDRDGRIAGYHSSRRKPRPEAVAIIADIYRKLLEIEQGAVDRKVGMQAAYDYLVSALKERGVTYDEFVFSL